MTLFRFIIASEDENSGHVIWSQGRRHEDLFGGGGRFLGTQPNLPPKLSLSSDFGHFILKMLKNAKFKCQVSCQEKVSEISSFLGDVPR